MPSSKARPSQGCVPKANEVIQKEGLVRERLLKREKKNRMWRSSQASYYKDTVETLRTAIGIQWKLLEESRDMGIHGGPGTQSTFF